MAYWCGFGTRMKHETGCFSEVKKVKIITIVFFYRNNYLILQSLRFGYCDPGGKCDRGGKCDPGGKGVKSEMD